MKKGTKEIQQTQVEQPTEKKETLSELFGTSDESEQIKIVKGLAQRSDVAITILFMANGSMDVVVAGARLNFDQISDMLSGASKECAKQAERIKSASNNQDGKPTV